MSAALGALIAHLAFSVLLVRGWLDGSLGLRGRVTFIVLWLVGLVVFERIPYLPFASFVAILDIALVVMIFKGDVRLT